MMRVSMVLVVLLLLTTDATAFTTCSRYESEVTDWLDSQQVSWRKIPDEFWPLQSHDNGAPPLHASLLELTTASSDRPSVLLHLVSSPTCLDECVSPILTKTMTDSSCQPIIHLHQDVWRAKHDIVCQRLLMRLGKTRSRIYARKTVARRITADIAREFLQIHHLWSATKAKHNYGLFARTKENDENETLVAVATFSKCRTVMRKGIPHQSHELLRFCTRRDGTVVGGISKLVKAFIVDQEPDDIVTVIDRDWGGGSGWHSLGFQTAHIMPPLVMVISKEDGTRRHLVGAGIQKESNDNKKRSAERYGLPSHVLEELGSVTDASKALECLAEHGFYPVYDTGVERLMMLVPNSEAMKNREDNASAAELWKYSVPTYASSYYSRNSGIAVILKSIDTMDSCSSGPLDSKEDVDSLSSWRATGGTAKSSKLVFSSPSSLDPKATVEVRERPCGWRTVGIVGGATASIYHGINFVDEKGQADASVIVSEHDLRTMASLAFAALEMRHDDSNKPLRFLHFGYGAGTLSRLVHHCIADSEHVAVEVDSGVAAAARELSSSRSTVSIEVGDALKYC